jgi:hypothetical protein
MTWKKQACSCAIIQMPLIAHFVLLSILCYAVHAAVAAAAEGVVEYYSTVL